jgi:hypothetical protein
LNEEVLTQWGSVVPKTNRSGLKFKEETGIRAHLCMVLRLGHFEKHIINTWIVFKCGAGEGWRRSAGPICEK